MKINDLQNFVFQNTRYLLINYPEYGKDFEEIELTLIDILEKSTDMLESKRYFSNLNYLSRLLMEKLEILQKWTSIQIPQEKVDDIVKLYKKRLDEVVLTRDTARSPDKLGEEQKYKYLEKVNSQPNPEDNEKDEDQDSMPKITLFPAEDSFKSFSLPNNISYYHRKNSEISKIVKDPFTVGLLSLNDLAEDIFEYNYSPAREVQKNLNVSKTIERLTNAIKAIRQDGKELIDEKFGTFIIEPFGSSVNGTYMHSKKDRSDLDISINFYYNPAVVKGEVLQDILPAIDSVSAKNFDLVLDSKVPIAKYTDSVTGEE